jgi:hypothetical protein
LAAWDLSGRLARFGAERQAVTALRAGLGVLALVWGLLQTGRGITEASATDDRRGLPFRMSLVSLGAMVRSEIPEGEAVMSNLGPTLAWFSGRPVVHLARTPTDVAACRRYLDVRHVILAFRDASRAWPGWDEIVARPTDTVHRPELHVSNVRQFQSPDGFSIVWLELSPLEQAKAGSP